MSAIIKDSFTILKTSLYGDSSLIINALGQQQGLIGVIAKGARKKPDSSLPQVLNDYELSLYPPKEAGLYLLKECSLTTQRNYQKPKNWATALCGVELLRRQIIPNNENQIYHHLLSSFLDFLLELEGEPLPVFWRLLLRMVHLQGFVLNTNVCAACHKPAAGLAYTKIDAQLFCNKCANGISDRGDLHVFGAEASQILINIDHIGKHLDKLTLSKQSVQEINNFFLDFYVVHNQQTLKLNSLSVLEQFYS